MRAFVALLTAVLLVPFISAQEESLADLARRERARKNAVAKPVSTPEGKALLAKVIAGLGSEAKVKSVRSVRARASQRVQIGEAEVKLDVETRRVLPDRLWQNVTSADGEYVLVITPKTAFQTSGKGVQEIDGMQADEALQQMARDPIFVCQHADDPEFVFREVGTANVGGVETRVLEVSGPRAKVRWFIDPQTGRIARAAWNQEWTEDGEPLPAGPMVIEDYSDYRQVDGIWFFFKEVDTREGGEVTTLTFTQYELNPPVDLSLFARPGATPQPQVSNDAGTALLAKVVQALGGEKALAQVRVIRSQAQRRVRFSGGEQIWQLDSVTVLPDKAWQRAQSSGGEMILVSTPGALFMTVGGQTIDLPLFGREEVLMQMGLDPARDPIYLCQHAGDPDFVFRAGATEKIAGTEATILDISSPAADVRWFVDARTGRILRASWKATKAASEITRDFSHWKAVDGVWLPFQEVATRRDGTVETLEFAEIAVNPAIDAAMFSKPVFPIVDRPELRALAQARSIEIVDAWGGLGIPHGAKYDLKRGTTHFYGPATFTVGRASRTDAVSIPLDAAEAFLHMLGEAQLEEREYFPNITHTDDYPTVRIVVELADGTIEFFTGSQGKTRVPWAVAIQGKTYVINSPVPANALAILDPYLKREVLQELRNTSGALKQ